MKTNHTPGPWRVTTVKSNGAGDYPGVLADESFLVASCSWGTKEKAEANAKLIAAAPDLLEAILEIKELADRENTVTEEEFLAADAKLDAAIKKATL